MVGGLICVIGQLLIDLTKLTPARIMVLYVTGGVVLGALGWYAPLVHYAGCGATVPLSGFGYLLAEGVAPPWKKRACSAPLPVAWRPRLQALPPRLPSAISRRCSQKPGDKA